MFEITVFNILKITAHDFYMYTNLYNLAYSSSKQY